MSFQADQAFQEGEGGLAYGEVLAFHEFASQFPVGGELQSDAVFVDGVHTPHERCDLRAQTGGVVRLDDAYEILINLFFLPLAGFAFGDILFVEDVNLGVGRDAY